MGIFSKYLDDAPSTSRADKFDFLSTKSDPTSFKELNPTYKKQFIDRVVSGERWADAKKGVFNRAGAGKAISQYLNESRTPLSATETFTAKLAPKIARTSQVLGRLSGGVIGDVARVGGRVMAPLALAADAYTIGKAGYEGYKAYNDDQDAKRNEDYQNKNYGTIDAATATRRRRLSPPNPVNDYLDRVLNGK